jgi:hypothetical protein
VRRREAGLDQRVDRQARLPAREAHLLAAPRSVALLHRQEREHGAVDRGLDRGLELAHSRRGLRRSERALRGPAHQGHRRRVRHETEAAERLLADVRLEDGRAVDREGELAASRRTEKSNGLPGLSRGSLAPRPLVAPPNSGPLT